MRVGHPLELSKIDIQCQLPLHQFMHTRVVSPEKSCGAVNNEQPITSSAKDVVCFIKKPILVLSVERLSTRHVFQHIFFVNAESPGNSHQSLWPECVFSVQIQYLALATSVFRGQLTCNRQSVAKLCLTRTEFPIHFGDLAWLDTSTKKAVQLCRACRDLERAPAHMQHVGAIHHPNRHKVLSCRHDPLCFLHIHSFNLQQFLQGNKHQCFHAGNAATSQGCNISHVEARTTMRGWCTKPL
mmetsp:Transcript_75931/g.150177  ORF Transcript_75931/g.150177 Transcript_75931/m.150177 type:complete len:241 (-) Transcript_75931:196-918(-)